ncbi:sulfatase family protein [Rhodophyticola sp. CCM32]|uniref:sulfatase family protein n=1 Tax=Rhodophyticola sp. CCM32 TaxID=2916397 RepID=UPI001AF0080F|nr:sulfatase-like hydrolase/transferase [Rhodophyticola sp. CCM32]
MSKRPNILLLCTDQQRWDTLGATGNPYVNTPDIDRLYAEGAAVPHAYCQSPVCTPSRASFMTGRYPRTTGAYQNGQDLPPRERLISRILSEAGYACGLAGKLHVSACNPSIAPVHEPRHNDGFDSFHWSHHPSSSVRDQIDGTATDSAPNWPLNAHNMWLAERGKAYATEAFPDCAHIRIGPEAEDHQTTFCAEMARNFIQAHDISDTPWMYMVNFFDPHHPFDPPKAYLDRYLDQLDDLPLPSYRAGELEGKPPFRKKIMKAPIAAWRPFPIPR